MAPPGNRRPGYSRRAQYSAFFGYIAGAAGAAAGLVLLLISLANPGFMAGLRGLGADAAAPASRTMDAGKVQAGGLADTISGFLTTGSRNARLRRDLEHAKVRLVEADAVAEENRRLKALLGLMAQSPRPVLASRLIGSTATSTRRFATLGAGSNEGVTVGMPVRSPRGLVGRVLEVSRHTARVLLVTDTENLVPVRRATDGVAAFAQGRADGTLQIRLINLGINPLRKGDALVTSGSGGLYHPGTPIAIVHKLTSDGAIAQPLADPASSDYVIVEQVWRNVAPAPGQAAPRSAPAPQTARP